ncbi:MAG: hypothetical protein V4681_00790 [Patescibacteria group bacterium]
MFTCKCRYGGWLKCWGFKRAGVANDRNQEAVTIFIDLIHDDSPVFIHGDRPSTAWPYTIVFDPMSGQFWIREGYARDLTASPFNFSDVSGAWNALLLARKQSEFSELE